MDRRSFVAGLATAPLASTAVLDTTVIEPRNFGAAGDGQADDPTALQAALDAARRTLDGLGTEGGRAVIDLAGRQHVLTRSLRWPPAHGITLSNGTLRAGGSFPEDRCL